MDVHNMIRVSRRGLLLSAGVLIATGMKGLEKASAASLTLRLGHSGSQQWQGNLWAAGFAESLAMRAPGAKVEIFPNAQLGQDPALAQAVKLGTLDITVNGPVLTEYVPDLGVFDLPFLFRNLDDMHKIQDSAVGAKIKAEFEQQGFRFLGWVDIGSRDVTNNKRPINRASDLHGLKIRVPPGKIFVATFEALGASVQSINFGELYTALQQGVVDGEENPPTTIRVMKFYEVQKYLSLTRHIMSSAWSVMNLATYRRQPQMIRSAIDRAGADATNKVRQFMASDEQKSLRFLKAKGMLVNEPSDPASFRKATRSVLAAASPSIHALAKEIQQSL